MLDTFNSFNSRDFRQRYQGSYGFITSQETKRRVLVSLTEVSERVVKFVDVDGIGYTAIADTGVEFEFLPAKKKLFICEGNLLYIRRRPARMWARGVNTQNTLLNRVSNEGALTLTFPRIVAAFCAEPVDVLQTCNLMEQGQTSCVALSDIFGVSDGDLFVYDERIGQFSTDTKEIKLNDSMFFQEVLDLVTRIGLPYKVSHG